ncbi:MAG: ABC transporter permease subunit [Vallitaleaceae bacterium]|nr:ABC transporter permease subunit [Vallitaleaceae bacterium]
MSAVFAFLYVPIFVLIVFSFNQSRQNAVWTGFTFDWYVKLMSNDEVLRALGNTLEIACISTIIATMIGTLAAVGMYKYTFKGKTTLDNLLYIPVVIPEIVLGIALLIFFNRTHFPLGVWSLIIAHATFSIPFVVITVKSRMAGFDKSLEEAAMDLGASQFKTFIYITLPNILPGVISGALLSFTLSLDDVITSFFVAGPGSTTLPLQIFSMVRLGVSPEINALSTLMLLASVVIAIISEKFNARAHN